MEMFIDSNILDSYYTTKLYNDICKNKDKEVNNIIEDITMKDDFIIKKLTDIKTRVVLLESFNDSFQTKLVDNIITVNKFPVENMDKMLVNYNHAFRVQGKPVELNNKRDACALLFKMNKQVYGSLFKTKKIMIKHERINQYTFNPSSSQQELYERIQDYQKTNNKEKIKDCLF